MWQRHQPQMAITSAIKIIGNNISQNLATTSVNKKYNQKVAITSATHWQ